MQKKMRNGAKISRVVKGDSIPLCSDADKEGFSSTWRGEADEDGFIVDSGSGAIFVRRSDMDDVPLHVESEVVHVPGNSEEGGNVWDSSPCNTGADDLSDDGLELPVRVYMCDCEGKVYTSVRYTEWERSVREGRVGTCETTMRGLGDGTTDKVPGDWPKTWNRTRCSKCFQVLKLLNSAGN